MLSRVANSLYWMSRYLERAENIARIVDVNLQLLLDFRNLDDQALAGHWVPIVQSTGDEQAFFALHKKATGQTVTQFLVFQPENPNSIVSSVAQSRENARMVRDQITLELWEELNRIYLFIRSKEAREVWRRSPSEFFQEIKAASLHVIGIISATMVHDEGWWFVQTGQLIERADKTTRILDVRHQTLPGFVYSADANLTGEKSGEERGIAQGGKSRKFVLGTRHGGSEFLVPFFCSARLAIRNAYWLTAVDEDFRQTLVPEGVLTSYRHHHAAIEAGYQRGQTGLVSLGTNPHISKAAFWCDPEN